MKILSNNCWARLLAFKLPLAVLAATSSLQGAQTFVLNNSLTNLGAGVAVWDITDGALTGTGTLNSTAPILSADPSTQTFTFDLAVAYSWTYDYVVTSTSPPSGGGAPVEDHEVEEFMWEQEDASGSSSTWGESYFTGDSALISGDATYGTDSNQNGVIVLVDDSGTGMSNSYISGAGGSNWGLGNGSGGGGGGGYSIGGSYGGGGSGTGSVSVGVTTAAVPEPSSASLLMLGTAAFVLRRKR